MSPAIELQNHVQRIIANEVGDDVGYLVTTLAAAHPGLAGRDEASGLVVALSLQATALASPILDFEAAARSRGWRPTSDDACIVNPITDRSFMGAGRWQAACEAFSIAPIARTSLQFRSVSDWLAQRLSDLGERVDFGFADLNVWAQIALPQPLISHPTLIAIAAREAISH